MTHDIESPPEREPASRGSPIEVLGAFLKLGVTSFGGPIAHLGYFRAEFVGRRRWIDDEGYSDLVALCQFLPGPASSQVGMALGLGRAGWPGALAAWIGFTLPSALALILFASGVAAWAGLAKSGILHGLKIMAVAVVAQAVWSMARSLCPDGRRRAIAIAAALLLLALPSSASQIAAIVMGGLLGWRLLSLDHLPPFRHRHYGVSKRTATAMLIVFGALLLGLPALAALTGTVLVAAIAAFYQAGSLVFGGGHVVLPLLQASVVPAGWIDSDTFLAGYGAAQAVPGPLFTFAAFLGAAMPAPLGGWTGGLLLLLAIFLPSFLLVGGALPYWETLRQRDGVRRAMAGVNAAVVGVLGAALYDPIATGAIHSLADLGLAAAACAALVLARLPSILVVILTAVGAWLIGA